MHNMHVTPQPGHRERKKLKTRNAIECAAVQIALEQGYEAATAEAIAKRADISLRTFFNYFPSKDVAIVGPGIDLIDEQRALGILDEAGPHLLKGICRVAEASVAAMGPVSGIMQDRRRLVQNEPRLLHVHMSAVMEFQTALERLVADYLRLHPERRRLASQVDLKEEARLAVGMVGSAVRHSLEVWAETDADVTTHTQNIERTIDMMAEIHRKD